MYAVTYWYKICTPKVYVQINALLNPAIHPVSLAPVLGKAADKDAPGTALSQHCLKRLMSFEQPAAVEHQTQALQPCCNAHINMKGTTSLDTET